MTHPESPKLETDGSTLPIEPLSDERIALAVDVEALRHSGRPENPMARAEANLRQGLETLRASANEVIDLVVAHDDALPQYERNVRGLLQENGTVASSSEASTETVCMFAYGDNKGERRSLVYAKRGLTDDGEPYLMVTERYKDTGMVSLKGSVIYDPRGGMQVTFFDGGSVTLRHRSRGVYDTHYRSEDWRSPDDGRVIGFSDSERDDSDDEGKWQDAATLEGLHASVSGLVTCLEASVPLTLDDRQYVEVVGYSYFDYGKKGDKARLAQAATLSAIGSGSDFLKRLREHRDRWQNFRDKPADSPTVEEAGLGNQSIDEQLAEVAEEDAQAAFEKSWEDAWDKEQNSGRIDRARLGVEALKGRLDDWRSRRGY